MSKMLIIRHISMGSEKTLNYTKNRYEWRITTIFLQKTLVMCIAEVVSAWSILP